jgi:hypothetical protein
MTRKAAVSDDKIAMTVALAAQRQRAYQASRRAWAKAVGRPYTRDPDLRPPPGELDVGPDE